MPAATVLTLSVLSGIVFSGPPPKTQASDRNTLILSTTTSPDGKTALSVGEHGRIFRCTEGESLFSLVSIEPADGVPRSDPEPGAEARAEATSPGPSDGSSKEPSETSAEDPSKGSAEASAEASEDESKSAPADTHRRLTDVLLTSLFLTDEGHGWAAGHDATILHTPDGGQTWDLQFNDPEAEAPFLGLWFEDAEHGLAVGAYGLAYETFDGGANWDGRDLDPEGPHLYAITESPAGSLYVAGEFGTILRSGDLGESWTHLEPPYTGTFFGSLALSDESLLVFGLRGHLYRSEDAGGSWVHIDVGTTASILAGLERADGTVLLVGLAGTVLESRDRGRSFQARNRPDRLTLTGVTELDGRVWLSSDQGMMLLDPDPSADRSAQ